MSETGPVTHGFPAREMTARSLAALDGHGDPGRFGRMFPDLAPLLVDDDRLAALAEAMRDGDAGSPGGDNPRIPAGYTYLGQFIDHDITLDLTPLSQKRADPLATVNFRSPRVDLDSVYGQGPGVSPFLYQRDPATGAVGAKMLIGKAIPSPGRPGEAAIPELPNDLPRNAVGRALIADERNDENLLVAQTHLAFLKFHNKVVDWVSEKDKTLKGMALFEEARRVVTWHYQWIVLFDFVETLTRPGLVREIIAQGRKFYRFKSVPYMPAEFAAAVFRLGHSMVRERYDHNKVFNGQPGALGDGTLDFMFFFTGKSGAVVGELVNHPGVGAFPPLGPLPGFPSNWVIDWRRFFDLGPKSQGVAPNASRALDAFVTPALHSLPGFANGEREGMLPFRNLRRGVQVGLPSGQAVAKAMGVAPLSAADLAQGADGAAAAAAGLTHETPLWYYVLKEAAILGEGERLGPVGGRLLAETFIGMVHGQPGEKDSHGNRIAWGSFLWERADWKPELPSATPGHFTMADLLRWVDDINPVG